MRSPIFIVGNARSGTTLLRLLLDTHPHIASGPETKFLADLEKIVDDDWEPIASSGADPEEVEAAAAAAAEGDKSDEAEGGDEREQDDIIVA